MTTLKLEAGALPWMPNEDVYYYEPWAVDDLPIMGELWLINGERWLFCVDGELHKGRQRWWYAPLTEAPPPEFSDEETMTHWVDEHMTDAQEGYAEKYYLVDKET